MGLIMFHRITAMATDTHTTMPLHLTTEALVSAHTKIHRITITLSAIPPLITLALIINLSIF